MGKILIYTFSGHDIGHLDMHCSSAELGLFFHSVQSPLSAEICPMIQRAFLLLLILPFALMASERNQPNIIFFMVDDLGLMDTSVPMLTDESGEPHPHPLNQWYRTPHIEELAARRFTKKFGTAFREG